MLSVVLTDYAGTQQDIDFFQHAEWLNESTAVPYIYQQKVRWKVALVFAWIENPMKIICRYMKDEYATEQKAAIYASFFTRTAQKSNNSCPIISYENYNICFS